MHPLTRLAALPLAALAAAGCGAASSAPRDAPSSDAPQRAAAPFVTFTPAPRVIESPAPPLKQAIAIPEVKLPNPNGYGLITQAAKNIQPGGEGSPATSEKLSPEEDLKRQRAFTQKNAASLAMLRQGLKLPIVAPPARGLSVNFPAYAGQRNLARLVVQENAVFAADKQWARAVNGGLDVVQMGVALHNGGDKMAMLVGVAIEAIGRRDVMKWRGELSAGEAGRAAKRLEAIEARRPSFASILQEEMWGSLSSLRELFSGAEWKQSRQGNESKDFAAMFKDESDKARLRQTSDLQVEANFVASMQAAIAHAREPYSPQSAPLPEPADPLSALYTGSGNTQRTRLSYERSSAANRLLMTDLALQASTPPNAAYTPSLSALVPKYLQAVPRDPFAPASPLRYKRTGDTFVLYSVGPDGKDDGGAPVKGRGISIDSVGDVMPTS